METTDNKEPLSFVIGDLKYRVLSKKDKTVEVMAASIRYKQTNFLYEEYVIAKRPYLTGTLNIPSIVEFQGVSYTVIAIADRAFENHSSLIYSTGAKEPSGIKGVIIPSTVRKIGARAFYNCPLLKSINIPANVEIIGDGAFMNCFDSWDP